MSFDAAGRLDHIVQNLTGTGDDQTLSFDFNAAGQIVSRTGSDADYAWTPIAPATTDYDNNGLNQYTSVGGVAQDHDGRGNLETGGFGYDIHDNLTSGPSTTLEYDPALRLSEVNATQFLYDGAQIIAEYNGSTLQRRFVPGPGLDEPIVWYEGSGTTDRRWFVADERGSVIAITNSSGAATNINRYDEYGIPHGSNAGRFQFTGQPWLPEVSLYHMRARAYSPTLGRFVQTDPILHTGGMNLYAYVANDPLNRADPFGLQEEEEGIIVTGQCEPCRRRREAQDWLRQLQDQPGIILRTPWDVLDTDGDGLLDPDEVTEEKRLCARAQVQLAGLNQQIRGWARQLSITTRTGAAVGGFFGAERAGRSFDNAFNDGQAQQSWGANGPDREYLGDERERWTRGARGAFGLGRGVGALYVTGTTLGPATAMYIDALRSLGQLRRDLELNMAAAGCS